MLVNCKNYFNEESFNKVCDLLESGETVEIYIDCIGHTRAHYEGMNYKNHLKEKYCDRLVEVNGSYQDYVFRLRD